MGKTDQALAFSPVSRVESRRQQIGALGLDSYEVGGSIRDQLLGQEGKDLDVAVCGLTADQLLERLSQAGRVERLEVAGQLVGARLYCSWTGAEGIEFALARTEISTGDGHQQFSIATGTGIPIEEDLARRDFTINAMARAINPDGSPGPLLDPYGGSKDLAAGRLRMLGPRSLAEDPLRILRGLVRVGKNDLTIEAETAAAMSRQSKNIAALSAERVFSEVDALLAARHGAKALGIAVELGVYQEIFPELEPTVGFDQESKYHDLTVDQHCLLALQRAEELGASQAVRWAALLHDSGKPATAWRGSDQRLHYYANPDDPSSISHQSSGEIISRALLRRLRAPRSLEDKVSLLVAEHMFSEANSIEQRSALRNGIKARRLIYRVGRENIEDLLLLRRCDHLAKKSITEPPQLRQFEETVAEQLRAPLSVNELAVTGHDLLELGLRGPEIGAAQKELLRRVIDRPESNTSQQLLRWANKFVNESKPGTPPRSGR